MEQIEEAKSGELSIRRRLPNHVFCGTKHSKQNVTLKKIRGAYGQIILAWRFLMGYLARENQIPPSSGKCIFQMHSSMPKLTPCEMTPLLFPTFSVYCSPIIGRIGLEKQETPKPFNSTSKGIFCLPPVC